MLFYRKKFLLAVLEAFGGSVNSLRFQKYLFLILKSLNKKHYSFVPYRYGCFSFESYNDKRALIKDGFLLENDKKWVLNKRAGFISIIKPEEKEHIFSIKEKYEKLPKKNLLKQVYSRYPYYAINSQIIPQAGLNIKEEKEIKNKRPKQIAPCLFTIGYEGRSIDEYLNLLIEHNIKTLFDVRKNPLSRKYGFSKQSLQKTTERLKIEYLHIPGLGIESYLRKSLNMEQDYKNLFSFYQKNTLPKKGKELNNIISIFKRKKRVALTCFESDPVFCHRGCVASALKKKAPQLDIRHL